MEDFAPQDSDVPHDFRNAGRTPHRLEVAERIRQPPHSVEAEQGILGCILLSPKECLPDCIQQLTAGSQSFYDLRHQTIYEAALQLYDNKKAVDVVTMLQHLRDRKLLDEVGGVSYLASLPDAVPSAANILYYIDIVKEKHVLRRMIGTCTQTIASAYEHSGEVSLFLDKFGHDVNEIVSGTLNTAGSGPRSTKDLMPGTMSTIEEAITNKGAPIGLPTGLVDFDKLTRGLMDSEVTVVAARPSLGKTSIAINIAEYVGVELKKPVGVFSLEMSAESLNLRMVCSRARVNIRSVYDGFMAEKDFPKLTTAFSKLSAAPIYIDDSASLSVLQLKAKARQMAQKFGIKLFIIDYLQLLHSTAHRAENRQQEIADISKGVKALAKELSVPIILIAQLNREPEKRGPNSKPRLSDLRESGAIEQDADVVALLYRASDNETETHHDTIPINLIIAKQRNGPTGEIHLTFLKSYTRFESAAKISEEVIDDKEFQQTFPDA